MQVCAEELDEVASCLLLTLYALQVVSMTTVTKKYY